MLDTMWAHVRRSRDLPHAMKLLFANLMIEHDSILLYAIFGGSGITLEKMAALAEAATHPAVINHHAKTVPICRQCLREEGGRL